MSRKGLAGRLAAAAMVTSMAALSLTACGGGGDDHGGVLRVWGSEPQKPLVTTMNNETGGHDILKYLYDPLVQYKPDGSVENLVADTITPNKDNTEFDITIKPDQKFSDGTPVDAQSFVDAWNFGAAGKNAQLQQSFFEVIKGYDAVAREGAQDDHMSGLKIKSPTEFTVALKAPEADFTKRLGYVVYAPLPKVAFTDVKAFGEHPVGNGPYTLASDTAWQHNEGIELVKNPDYTGSREVKNEGLQYKFYTSNDTAYADLQSGALDTIGYTVPQSAYGTFEQDFPDSHSNKPYLNNYTFTIPERLDHFHADEEGRLRRQAISMAINRPQIVDKIYSGTSTPMTEFTTSALEGYDPEIPGHDVLTYNPQKAKETWARADAIRPWGGEFQIGYNADASHQAWVDAVTNDIKSTLGIQASGKPYPTFKQLRSEITDKTISSAFRTGWIADYPSRYNFLEPLFRTGGASNDGGYSSPRFDAALDEMQRAKDQKQTDEADKKAQEVLFQDLPSIPLWYGNAATAWNPDLTGVEIDVDGYPIYNEIGTGS